MGDRSAIEWTDATWNPIRGCSRVSEGCRNCYAERVAARFSGPGKPYEGLARVKTKSYTVGGGERTLYQEPRWTGEVRFVEESLTLPLSWKKPRRVFVNSMGDLFHEKVEDRWIDAVFSVMEYTPRHTYQILTKRPTRMREFCEVQQHSGYPVLPNVWLGVSVEDQATADERIPILLQTPAAVRWVSYEPALGPVDLSFQYLKPPNQDYYPNRRGLDWIVVGGESGPGARPFDLAWARSTIAQCRAAGVPVFVKQLGARPELRAVGGVYVDPGRWSSRVPVVLQPPPSAGLYTILLRDRKGGDMAEWPEDLRVREYPK